MHTSSLLRTDVRAGRWLGLGRWATVLGLCACSSDSANDGDGPGADAGAGVRVSESTAALLACLDLPAERRLSELSAQELEAACRGHRTCEAVTHFSVEEACRMQSVWAAVSAEPPASGQSELRSLCQSDYDQCSRAPADAVAALERLVEFVRTAPCGAPSQCDATALQIAECAADLRAQSTITYPACADLTADFDGRATTPASCQAMGGDCMDLLTIPSSN